MFWFLYNVLFTVGYLLMLPHFLFRMWKRGGYRKGFLQRFGIYSADIRERLEAYSHIWIHAVSVGEVFIALKFMEALREKSPEMRFVLTTTTSTGHRIAETRLAGGKDLLLYFPADFPMVVNRVLMQVKPKALILTECELWPNLIRKASDRQIPVILINGRISDSSFRGYCNLRVFFRPVLRMMDLLLVQSDLDRSRLLQVGADASSIQVLGSAKYDVASFDPDAGEKTAQLLAGQGITKDDLVMMGGSTWPGEEAVLCRIYTTLKSRYRDLKLILVPRHAERASEVEHDLKACGLQWKRRTALDTPTDQKDPVDIILVDSTGEMMGFYSCADVVFVGKSLLSHGGQNMIEPALLGKAVLVGPHMENFPVVLSDFLDKKAVLQVPDESALCDAFDRLLGDHALRKEYGQRACHMVLSKKGSIEQGVALALSVIDRV